MTPQKAAVARQHPVATIARTLGVSRAAVYRDLEAPLAGVSARPATRATAHRRRRESA